MKRIIALIMKYLKQYNCISAEDEEIYRYGIDIVIYTVLSTLGLLFVSLLLGKWLEGLVIIIVYYINQTIGGGYHAKSHCSCFISMAVALLFDILILLYVHNMVFYLFCSIASSVFLFICPIVIHPNKAYLNDRKEHLTKRMRITVAIEIIVGTLLYSTFLFPAFSMGLLCSAISRAYAYFDRIKVSGH